MEKACPWLMDLKISLFSTGCQGCRKARANENKNSNPKHPSWGIATLCIYPAFFIGLATFGRQTDKESGIYTQDGDSPIQKGKQHLVLSNFFCVFTANSPSPLHLSTGKLTLSGTPSLLKEAPDYTCVNNGL